MSDPWTRKVQGQTWLWRLWTICYFHRRSWNLIYLHLLELFSCSSTLLPSGIFPRAGRMATSHSMFPCCLLKLPWLCHMELSRTIFPLSLSQFSLLLIECRASVRSSPIRECRRESVMCWGGWDVGQVRSQSHESQWGSSADFTLSAKPSLRFIDPSLLPQTFDANRCY